MTPARPGRAAGRPLSPRPSEVYRRLLRYYGRQGWWPVTVGRGAGAVYRPGFRGSLSQRQRAEICFGAILTQNTAWANVEKALFRMRAAGLLDLTAVAQAPPRRLERLVRPSGYFRQKARALRFFAGHALGRGPLSAWLSGPLPALRRELLGLWGLGPETADSILLYAGQRPVFVVDAYTLRLGLRLGWFEGEGYAAAQKALAESLAARAEVYAEFHALIVAHAKRHCRAVARCEGCPLLEVCAYGRSARRPS